MGIRTPDLLHAISRQPVHRSPSPQATVLSRPPEYAVVPVRCGTFLLYAASGSGYAEALGGLPGDLGDEPEILVQVQHGQPGQFRCCGDDQVRDGRSTVQPRSASAA
jgi:hypothetical protein